MSSFTFTPKWHTHTPDISKIMLQTNTSTQTDSLRNTYIADAAVDWHGSDLGGAPSVRKFRPLIAANNVPNQR